MINLCWKRKRHMSSEERKRIDNAAVYIYIFINKQKMYCKEALKNDPQNYRKETLTPLQKDPKQ